MAKKRSTSTALHMELPTSLTIDVIESFSQNLLEKLTPKTRKAVLDAEQLENITTPGIQMLFSLHLALEAQGATLSLENTAPHIGDAFAKIGLEPFFTSVSSSSTSGDSRE